MSKKKAMEKLARDVAEVCEQHREEIEEGVRLHTELGFTEETARAIVVSAHVMTNPLIVSQYAALGKTSGNTGFFSGLQSQGMA